MNDRKWKQLFDVARKERPPSPPEGFFETVRQSIGRDAVAERAMGSLFDQLNLLFPRLAWAAAALIFLCVAGELVFSAARPELTDEVAQLSDQGVIDANDF
jgi:hypothetical protein